MDDVERRLRDLGERTSEDPTFGSASHDRIVRRARRRRALAVAVPTLAAAVLVAVVYPTLGRESGGGGPPVELAAVARATEDAETARLEIEITTDFGEETTTMRGMGEVDFSRDRSYLRMETTGSYAETTREMIAIGNTVYHRIDGATWHRFDVEGAGKAFGAGTGPADFLTYLESWASDVTVVEKEELDGVAVTHYRATVDPHVFDDALTRSRDMEFDPMEVWVDRQGLLRKMTFGSTFGGPSGSETTMWMTMRLWDFGIPVDVQAPDPEDVTDEPLIPEHSSTEGSHDDWPTVVVGRREWSEPYVVIPQEDRTGPNLVCIHVPHGPQAKGVIVDEVSRDVIVVANRFEAGAMTCPSEPIAHELADLLLSEPTRFTVRVGRGERRVVVELAEVFGRYMEE